MDALGEYLQRALQTGLCLVIFYLFFKLLMSREALHRINRILLLTAMVGAFLLPLCRLTLEQTLDPAAVRVGIVLPTEEIVATTEVVAMRADFWWRLLGCLYGGGVLTLLGWRLGAMGRLVRLIRRSDCMPIEDGVVVVRSSEVKTPFSWGRYVVLGAIEEEADWMVLCHERAHIGLRHTYDLALFDLLGALQWFNPAMWLLRRDLKTIHEYEADQEVLRSGIDARAYQLLLIKKAVGGRWYSIANSLNHSNLKKRITMMLQKQSSRWAVLKLGLLLPLVGLAVVAFAETRYVVSEDKDRTKNQLSQTDGHALLKLRCVDENQQPLAGVILLKQGTSEGVCSDQQGRAELQVAIGDRLECLYIGKQNYIYPVEQITDEEVLITMSNEAEELESIVVSEDEDAPKSLAWVEKSVETPQKEIVQAASSEGEPAEPFLLVEQKPSFLGGDLTRFRQWLQQQVVYPRELQVEGVQGRVVVSFVVASDGSVGEIRVLQSPDQRLSDQVMKALASSPRWEPGEQRGKAVSLAYTLPIDFKPKWFRARMVSSDAE